MAIEVLWLLAEDHTDPRLLALLTKYNYRVVISYDNAMDAETAAGEWSGKSEPALEPWLWRLREIVKNVGIAICTRWKKSHRDADLIEDKPAEYLDFLVSWQSLCRPSGWVCSSAPRPRPVGSSAACAVARHLLGRTRSGDTL